MVVGKIMISKQRFMAHTIISIVFIAINCLHPINAFSATTTTSLIESYVPDIASLKTTAKTIVSDPPTNDVFYLRYCLAHSDTSERVAALTTNLNWRNTGSGKLICDAATKALKEATATSYENDPIRQAAPHASTINSFITPQQIITTTSPRGDLVYCIRAGKIDDVELMSKISEDEMVEFFLYCREIISQVANERSMKSDKLVRLIVANDLSGVKLIGGDATFRNALSASSKKANELYPELSGPTLLLNLPPLFGALVKLFTPLFPPAVRKKLKFEKGVLEKGTELEDYLIGGTGRSNFEKDLENLVYKDGEW